MGPPLVAHNAEDDDGVVVLDPNDDCVASRRRSTNARAAVSGNERIITINRMATFRPFPLLLILLSFFFFFLLLLVLVAP